MARIDQRRIPLLLVVLAIGLVAARAAMYVMKTRSAPASSLVHWLTPEEGERAARASNKIVLYDFTAEWCAPCHLLEEEVFRNADIASDINARFIPVRVTDRQQEDGSNPPAVETLQQRYSVRGFPTVVFADAAGTERARMEGFRGREEFERVMESVR